MSGVDVAALREKLARRTPGTWNWKRGPMGGYIRKGRLDLFYMNGDYVNGDLAAIGDPGGQQIDADAEAIVALVNAAPALLDELEEARARIRDLTVQIVTDDERKNIANEILTYRADLTEARARLARQDAVVLKAMALTDVWSGFPDAEFATVMRVELEELADAVEPFRHTALNPLHDAKDCEVCALDTPAETP